MLESRLADFIRGNSKAIILEWERFALTRTPASHGMTREALRDHIVQLLEFLVRDLESSQTAIEQVEKSQGDGPKKAGAQYSAAESHADLRLADGFDMEQLVAEYRALRASVVKLWSARNRVGDPTDFADLIRFNEAVDQAVAESVAQYTKTLDRSRNLTMGILGHDLLNPIAAARSGAELLLRSEALSPQHSKIASMIRDATLRADKIVTDLLDLTRVQVGADLPVDKVSIDLGLVGKKLVTEMRACYPGRAITLEIVGDVQGEFDEARLGQVFANLIGNAVEHGFADTSVAVTLEGKPKEVVLAVHNQAAPIPPDKISRLFEAFVQGESDRAAPAENSHLGLGLFITRKIVESHQGSIGVTSSKADGTRFTAHLPRH